MEREMEVRVVRAGAEVDLVGRLDAKSASRVRDALQACVDAGEGDLLLHVGGLEIWDSTGLGVLLNGLRALSRRQGKMALVCPNEKVLRPFQVTGLADRMPIFASREAALGAV